MSCTTPQWLFHLRYLGSSTPCFALSYGLINLQGLSWNNCKNLKRPGVGFAQPMALLRSSSATTYCLGSVPGSYQCRGKHRPRHITGWHNVAMAWKLWLTLNRISFSPTYVLKQACRRYGIKQDTYKDNGYYKELQSLPCGTN